MGARLLNDQLGTRQLVARTPWGQIRLSLPWDAASNADGLIQQLNHWCQQTLTFVAAAVERIDSDDAMEGVVADVRLAPLGTQLIVPQGLLKSVAPPLPLQGAAIRWQPLTFHVTVATLAESCVEPAHAQENGMVLLPEAFHPPWMVQLQTQDQNWTLWGHLHLNAGSIDLVGNTQAGASHQRQALLADDAAAAWLVHLARPLVLDLPVAMGWTQGVRTVPVDYSCDPSLQSEFGLSALLRHSQRDVQLPAMVVPVMLGAALNVQTMHGKL